MRGATALGRGQYRTTGCFNSRSPSGERRFGSQADAGAQKFQHTLPVRGVTLSRYAPLSVEMRFNTRSPSGERHRRTDVQCLSSRTFQLTLPERGATEGGGGTTAPRNVSTHAPRAGSDPRIICEPPKPVGFNSRSPCEERPRTAPPACCRV